MGRPNFQRLAELGQLPEYVTPSFNEALAQVDAMNKKKLEVEEAQVVEDAKIEAVEDKPKRGRKSKEIVEVEVKEEEKPGEFVDPLLQ